MSEVLISWRRLSKDAVLGGFLGLLTGLLWISRLARIEEGYRGALDWRYLESAILLALAPGMFFGFGSRVFGLLVNALIWAGTFVVWRGRSLHWSAKAAKVITALCWCAWLIASFVQAALVRSA